ncbi:MAG: thioredoxin family protein [Candidatus Thiodiazotropha lotti]|uniref:Thioredoxin family protein n=1 Tax=Candidatus Thiodiazotropha lotti TaxID=2792787 RepID=A0A9E4K7F8_9GAMM|nr:thioredoxin family protein [Candidatus Thiodiazotropha endoloripes]MCG7873126.1 thioredoxin family protein [Candidatus Thiodiazotropha lotti]MCG7902462.1 thioredoxin family protein [Candidatus Thiodiazotropha weberae]MCG7912917.1 thioredoxin family protein [Candidatus Thiodiazotropha weberae]MCG7920538.1 thioredoxin family protein [Candidatus Thiodiazotropha lotti]MCG7930582.1 thioredoxin family protein [Candidatus Thiodiazotropha lotti]
MKKAIFYHAGCPVCVAAEQQVLDALDKGRYELEVVHLGADRSRIVEAEQVGIQSVPALLLDGGVFHINFGASLADVKGGS